MEIQYTKRTDKGLLRRIGGKSTAAKKLDEIASKALEAQDAAIRDRESRVICCSAKGSKKAGGIMRFSR